MKKIFTIYLFLYSCIVSNAQTSSQGFEGATFPPVGWSNSGCIRSTNNDCGGLVSCGFNGFNDAIITPLIVGGMTISFDYVRSSNSTAWSLEVEHSTSVSGPWTNLGTINNATTTCQNASFAIPNNVYVRFRDTRSSGANERYIDNVTVQDLSLPIEITSFTVKSASTVVDVKFSTASELNNDYFAIERSSDGRTFNQIGEVKGAGTSLTKQDYTFTDEKPLRGINYYRLKQVDFDGQFTYSSVVSVQFGKVGNVVIYPTPATETVNVRLEENLATDAQWQIIDMTGRVVSEGVFAAEQLQYSLPVATLTQGAYVLRVTAEQEVLTQQFRKQ